MGLTGEERCWIEAATSIHKLFCQCKEPLEHLTRCLMEYTQEELDSVAAMAAFDLGGDATMAEGGETGGDAATTKEDLHG
ncbi:ORF2 [torque teno Delphinidae virus 5]